VNWIERATERVKRWSLRVEYWTAKVDRWNSTVLPTLRVLLVLALLVLAAVGTRPDDVARVHRRRPVKPFGRWCEKCEAMVPADHRTAMLMQRKANHDPIVLFVREDTDGDT